LAEKRGRELATLSTVAFCYYGCRYKTTVVKKRHRKHHIKSKISYYGEVLLLSRFFRS